MNIWCTHLYLTISELVLLWHRSLNLGRRQFCPGWFGSRLKAADQRQGSRSDRAVSNYRCFRNSSTSWDILVIDNTAPHNKHHIATIVGSTNYHNNLHTIITTIVHNLSTIDWLNHSVAHRIDDDDDDYYFSSDNIRDSNSDKLLLLLLHWCWLFKIDHHLDSESGGSVMSPQQQLKLVRLQDLILKHLCSWRLTLLLLLQMMMILLVLVGSGSYPDLGCNRILSTNYCTALMRTRLKHCSLVGFRHLIGIIGTSERTIGCCFGPNGSHCGTDAASCDRSLIGTVGCGMKSCGAICDNCCCSCFRCGDLMSFLACKDSCHRHCYDYCSVYYGGCYGDGSIFNAVHGDDYYRLFDVDCTLKHHLLHTSSFVDYRIDFSPCQYSGSFTYCSSSNSNKE